MARTIDISNSDDVIDVRDVIARVEALREDETKDDDEIEELKRLESLLEDLAGYGGDHQWEGVWYPVTLIHADYWQRYAEEFASDIGAITPNASWPNNHIDWEAAADELKQDYATVDFAGEEYYYR